MLVDPMLATGGSAASALRRLKERGAQRLRFVCLVAAPEGVEAIRAEHPDVPDLLRRGRPPARRARLHPARPRRRRRPALRHGLTGDRRPAQGREVGSRADALERRGMDRGGTGSARGGARARRRRLAVPRRRPAAGPGHPLRPARRRAAAAERRAWRAAPILVSGATAYRDGEFLYQDFLYDDHGADGGQRDPATRAPATTRSRSPTAPTPTRPTRATRTTPPTSSSCGSSRSPTRPRSGSRSTRCSTPSVVGVHDRDRRARRRRCRGRTAPASRSPAELFLTVHGTTRRAARRATGAARARPAPTPSACSTRHAARSRSASRTRRGTRARRTVRLAAGVGLWDAATGALPRADRRPRPRRTPGGAGALARPPALFNVAFRSDEPMPRASANPLEHASATRRGGATARRASDAAHRRHLRASSPNVDFGKLAARRRDDDVRRAADRPDQPHPREPLRARAGRRLHAACLRRRRAAARASCSAGCSPTRSTCPKPQPPARLRLDAAHALARRELQPVPRQPQPVAVRRARAGLDRDRHAVGPRAGRLVRRARRGRRLRGVGRRRAPLPARPRAGPSITGYSMGGIGTFRLADRSAPTCSPRASRRSARPASASVPPRPEPGGAQSNTFRSSPRCATSRS